MRNKSLKILITLLIILISLSVNAKLFVDKVDNLKREQLLRDSIQNLQIAELKSSMKSFEINESFFSNEITILTAIFSTIVAISIFLIGYLIPMLNNKKYKSELAKLLAEFKTIRDEIELSRKITANLETKHNVSHSKIMFFSCVDAKQQNGVLLWALRHAKDIYNHFKFSENKNVEFYINSAANAIDEIPKESHLREDVDEVNKLTNELMEIFSDSIDGIKEKLISIKERYNKIAWSVDSEK